MAKLTPTLSPGLYRHYSGDLYRLLFVAQHSETDEWFAVYVAFEHPESGIRVRPIWGDDSVDAWTDPIEKVFAKSKEHVPTCHAAQRLRFDRIGP